MSYVMKPCYAEIKTNAARKYLVVDKIFVIEDCFVALGKLFSSVGEIHKMMREPTS